MSVRIRNKTKQLLNVSLNSGKTIQLPPGESSSAIEDLEVKGSEEVSRLVRSNLIVIDQVGTAPLATDKKGLQKDIKKR